MELGSGDVHVWRARLDVNPAVLRTLHRTLAPGEVERAGQFRLMCHRNLFTAARGILRHILSGYVRMAPAALPLRSSEKGKPFLDHSWCGIHFNVSHSGTAALYAVARREVGVDIEQIDARFATADIAMRVLTGGELAEWSALPPCTRVRALFDCWTRKEACLKGCAEGLSLPLTELEAWSAGEKHRVLLSGGRSWSLRSFDLVPGFSAAMAVDGGCAKLRFMDFRFSDSGCTISSIDPGIQTISD